MLSDGAGIPARCAPDPWTALPDGTGFPAPEPAGSLLFRLVIFCALYTRPGLRVLMDMCRLPVDRLPSSHQALHLCLQIPALQHGAAPVIPYPLQNRLLRR